MLKRKQGETYAQHRARVLDTVGLGSRLVTIAGGLLVLAVLSISIAPSTPDKVPAQQIRDSRGAAKFAYYNGEETP